jgi:aminoglycoside 3-N-acetyltransferase
MLSVRRIFGSVRRFAVRGLRPLTHRWLTRRRLAGDLQALGVGRGGILLVHSSLSALGYVPGGTGAVIGGLLDAVGPEGTLMMPAHSWDRMEAGCRTFDARATACCVGVIAEAFRHWPGAIRSLHPTHSVAAVGPRARALVEGHELAATPCGADTPYVRALEQDCQVLFLGVGLQYNTAFHTVEALAEVPYLLHDRADEFTVVDTAGVERRLPVLRHRARVPRRFEALEPLLVEQSVARKGLVGHVPCLLLNGRAFLDRMLPAVRQDSALLLVPGHEPAALSPAL